MLFYNFNQIVAWSMHVSTATFHMMPHFSKSSNTCLLVRNKLPSLCEDFKLCSPSEKGLGPCCRKLAAPLRHAQGLNSMWNLWMLWGNFLFQYQLKYLSTHVFIKTWCNEGTGPGSCHSSTFLTWFIIIWFCIWSSFEWHCHIVQHWMCHIHVYTGSKSNEISPPVTSQGQTSESGSCRNISHILPQTPPRTLAT